MDWVTQRQSCGGAEMFLTLKAHVSRDVDTRNQQLLGKGPWRFEFKDDGHTFSVLLKTEVTARWVQFSYEGDTLKAVDGTTGKTTAEAKVVLSGGSGSCVLQMVEPKVNMPVEHWYFRYLALDRLFFAGVPPTP